MMTISKTITFATCLLSFFAFTHGSKNRLIRTKSLPDTDARRLETLNKLSSTDNDVQSIFPELLGYNNNQKGWDSSMSFSMSMRYGSPMPSSTVRPATATPTTDSPSLRPTATSEPTASPVVVKKTPMTRIIPVKSGIKATGGADGKEQEASPIRLSGGVIVGIAVAAVAIVVVVAAIVAKNRIAASPVT